MSFANIDLEAQKSLKTGKITEDSPGELDKLIDNTSNQLQVFGNLISQFEVQRKSIGTKRDNQILRNKLDGLISKLNELEKAIKKLLANFSMIINKNSDEKTKKIEITNRQIIIQERLINEYNDLYRQYSKSQKEYNEKKRLNPITETTPLLETSSYSPQQQTQTQIEQVQTQDSDIIEQTELEYHRLLTEERNREIAQAAEGIQEVNSIFKDLGALVNQQGEQLDLVEDNIAELSTNAQLASRELNKAHEYQKKKGKWSCIILIALCIFVLVIVLAILS